MSLILRIRLGVVLALLSAVLFVWTPVSEVRNTSPFLQVRFLDVGQGDAIHVQTPDGYEMLIDGGATAAVLRELAVGRSLFDRSIDVVVATHPDADHIGGLVDIMDRYEVGSIVQTTNRNETPVAVVYDGRVAAEGAEIIAAQAGQVIQLGASTTIKLYAPHGDTTDWRSNAASVIIQVSYGDIDFMLTGDAPSSIEEYISRDYGAQLQSEVLKLGHHGSKTSTSEIFLSTVQPEIAVVSAGKDNQYGHPHDEVVTLVEAQGIEIVSTAEQGTITFLTDGVTVWQK